VLEGIDTLVFTGGIGEHDADVRWEVCRGLRHLGIEIDRQRNASNGDPVSGAGSQCTVRVIPTNEDLVIVRHTRAILRSAEGAKGPS
jgi:acetate kinase